MPLIIETTLYDLCELLQVQITNELGDEALAAVAAEAIVLDLATDPEFDFVTTVEFDS